MLKGEDEFKTPVSAFILVATVITSILQMVLTLILFI